MKQIKLCEGGICSFESISFPTAHRWPSFCNENPLNVVLRQTDEAVDLPGGFVLVDIELRLREHIAHRLKMVCPKARRNKWMGVEVAVQPDLHDRV